MSKILIGTILLMSLFCSSQNNQILYDFDNIPQTLALNPGTNYNHDLFIGIPLLSGISIQGGVTGLNVYDIFSDDGRNINDKIREVIYKLDAEDSFILNERLDILSGGFNLKNDDFLSFGFYQEFDFEFYYPRELVHLFYEGNTILNKRYGLEGLNFKAEMLGVFHLGLSRKVNKKLVVGTRLKLYSSVFNAQTKNNTGSLRTSLGVDNFYRHHIEDVNIDFQSSGVIYDDYERLGPDFFAKKMYSFENIGLGIDVGFTYMHKDQLKITGSILDIGGVKNSKDVFSYNIEGDYETEGIELDFDSDEPQEYWDNFSDDFENKLPIDTLYTSYYSQRPIKLNLSAKYSFGKRHFKDCNLNDTSELPYRNSVGVQFYLIKRPIEFQQATTLFYERRLGKYLRSKLTYTYDMYSAKNFGFGFSAKVNAFNLYFAIDNILTMQNLAKASSASVQFGMNIVIDK